MEKTEMLKTKYLLEDGNLYHKEKEMIELFQQDGFEVKKRKLKCLECSFYDSSDYELLNQNQFLVTYKNKRNVICQYKTDSQTFEEELNGFYIKHFILKLEKKGVIIPNPISHVLTEIMVGEEILFCKDDELFSCFFYKCEYTNVVNHQIAVNFMLEIETNSEELLKRISSSLENLKGYSLAYENSYVHGMKKTNSEIFKRVRKK